MHSFYVQNIANEQFVFNKKDVMHILKVLRLTINDQIICIYNNQRYLTAIVSIRPFAVKTLSILCDNTTKNYTLNLYVASIKPKKMEIAIAKATELNVDNFYIFYAARSQNNIVHNLSRYQKIIQQSAMQCRRLVLMNIAILDNNSLKQSFQKQDFNFVGHLSSRTKQLSSYFHNLQYKDIINKQFGLIIGPEGGLIESDLSIIQNPYEVNLTKTILRSETAAIYLCSVLIEQLSLINDNMLDLKHEK